MDLHNLQHVLDSGGGTEELLAEMRKRGCTKIESIQLLMKMQNISLGEAKQTVHDSQTWKDRKERDDEFQEGLISRLENADGRNTQ